MNDEITKLLLESVNLLMVGMIVVFAFLTVLIGAVKLMSLLVQRFSELPTDGVVDTSVPNTQEANSVSPEIVAAISAAVHQYRQK